MLGEPTSGRPEGFKGFFEEAWQCPNSVLAGPVPIRRRFGRFQLLLPSGINRRKCLPSSSAVVFAAFVDTFSFESQLRSSQKFFLSFWGTGVLSKALHLPWQKTKNLRVEIEESCLMFFSLLFYFLIFCSESDR